ncbi:hypothetical protein Q8F55_000052 [Vanrija albida]|uniref:F-box domain-containing protein n=1 Tax=Vanrija albida TaxID=181172 RepID=A0ABR3QD41_9TREE
MLDLAAIDDTVTPANSLRTRATVTTTYAVVIDHTAYPHIISRIIDHASYSILLALRATSATYRDRVNGILLAHACLGFLPLSSVWPEERLNARKTIPCRVAHDGIFTLSSGSRPTRRLPFVSQHVKILDLTCSMTPKHALLEFFNQVHTFRLTNFRNIGFRNLVEPAAVVSYVNNTRARPFNHPPAPDGAAERIIHFKYSSDVRGRPLDRLMSVNRGFCPHTLVLWPDDARLKMTDPRLLPELPMSAYAAILSHWTVDDPPMSLTVVGMEGHLHNGAQLPLVSKLWEQAAAMRLVPGSGPQHPPLPEKNVSRRLALEGMTRVITRNEWFEELGDRRRTLVKMPATIDHECYPHILDLIIAVADTPALLRLRLTSTAVRKQIDSLVAHAALAPGERFMEVAGRRLPVSRFQHYIRVHTIRRGNGKWQLDCFDDLPHVRTVVDFVDLSNAVADDRQINLWLPDQASRVVLHCKFDVALAGHVCTKIRLDGLSEANISNFILVLWPKAPDDEEQEPVKKPLKFIHYAIRALLQSWRGGDISITIVGLESAPECQRQTAAEFYASAASDRVRVVPWVKLKFTERQPLRLVTFEEWWEELAHEKDVVGTWPASA